MILILGGFQTACVSTARDFARDEAKKVVKFGTDVSSRRQAKNEKEEQKAKLERRRQQLAENAKKRIADGEKAPRKPRDPGHALIVCISPKPAENATSVLVSNYGRGGRFSCANTRAGLEIVKWRQWYCKGEESSCVSGKWLFGHPRFSGTREKPINYTGAGQIHYRYEVYVP